MQIKYTKHIETRISLRKIEYDLPQRIYVNAGLQGFHDYEVLELLLTHAVPRKDVKSVAKRINMNFILDRRTIIH